MKIRYKAIINYDDMEESMFVPIEKIKEQYPDGIIVGNLCYYGNTPYIIGDLVEANDEYCSPEFWYPVHLDSIELLEDE